MSDEERNKALMRRFYDELWSGGDLEALPEIIAEDFVDRQCPPGAPSGREGLAGLVAAWRTAFPDMRESVEHLVAEGEMVVGHFTMRGTHEGEFMGVAPMGRSVTMSVVDVVLIKDGRISELWYAEQMLELLQQLGAVPDVAGGDAEGVER